MTTTTPVMALDQALREEVERRGISYRRAGDLIGVPYQTLSNWATAKYRPSRAEDLAAIARFLRVKVGDVRAMRARMGSERAGTAAQLDEFRKELTALRESVGRLAARLDDRGL